MENNNISDIKSKVLIGLELTYQKLIQAKSKDDRVLVYFQQGKIVKVKAKDLENKK